MILESGKPRGMVSSSGKGLCAMSYRGRRWKAKSGEQVGSDSLLYQAHCQGNLPTSAILRFTHSSGPTSQHCCPGEEVSNMNFGEHLRTTAVITSAGQEAFLAGSQEFDVYLAF